MTTCAGLQPAPAQGKASVIAPSSHTQAATALIDNRRPRLTAAEQSCTDTTSGGLPDLPSCASRHPRHHLHRALGCERNLDQPQSARSVRAPHRAADILRLHTYAVRAERLAELDEIRVLELRADMASAEYAILEFSDRTEGVVVEHQHGEVQVERARGGELLHGEQEAAIAADRHHRLLRASELRADSRWQGVAERAVRSGVDQRARLIRRHE